MRKHLRFLGFHHALTVQQTSYAIMHSSVGCRAPISSERRLFTELELYACVLQTAPGITPALVERLVASRQDLTKADIKEVWLCTYVHCCSRTQSTGAYSGMRCACKASALCRIASF